AFHPLGGQRVLELGPAVFAVERTSPDGTERVLAIHNVTGDIATIHIPADDVRRWRNLLIDEPFDLPPGEPLRLVLSPFHILWLKAETAT
ncbi:MAG: sugar phosphorylase, partial [Chloroflexi bacterium]|nr:sugar phosphorylase [Chloroflexota bacterium]